MTSCHNWSDRVQVSVILESSTHVLGNVFGGDIYGKDNCSEHKDNCIY